MADKTKIEWTDATWNPITGCSIASPGCKNCYAMRLAGTRLKHHHTRVGLTQDTDAGPVWTGEIRMNRKELHQPLAWSRPRNIFVCAHGDLFHENVTDAMLIDVFTVMAIADQHTYQVLTKRADRMQRFLSHPDVLEEIYANWFAFSGKPREVYSWPLHNVWCGVSAERQKEWDERVPLLEATPAARRFVSAEPLIGRLLMHARPKLDWVIVGGESQRGARPMHPSWAKLLRDQCAAEKVAFFFKQWGEWAPVSQMSEELCESCYAPRSVRYPLASRRCLVDVEALQGDGTRLSPTSPMAFRQGADTMTMFRVGTKKAGRLLDGVEHNAMPAPIVPIYEAA